MPWNPGMQPPWPPKLSNQGTSLVWTMYAHRFSKLVGDHRTRAYLPAFAGSLESTRSGRVCSPFQERGRAQNWYPPVPLSPDRVPTGPCFIDRSFRIVKCNSITSDQIRSVAQSCPTLCDPMNRSTPGLPVHHQLPEFTETHFHWVSDAIEPSHPLSSPSPLAPNPSQHQSLFQWVNSSHEVAKVLEFQL